MARKKNTYNNVESNGGLIAYVFLIVFVVAAGAITNISLRYSIKSAYADIKRLENINASLCDELRTSEVAWARCNDPDRLERTLLNRGISMDTPALGQFVSLRGVTPRNINSVDDLVRDQYRVARVDKKSK